MTTLSSRQLECLFWIAAGKDNRGIAQILGISPLTVKHHVENLLAYYGTAGRTAAVVKALLVGDLSPEKLRQQYRLDVH